MPEEQFEKLVLYKATMSLVEQMLREGLVSQEEYGEIDRIFAKKYGFDLSVIYR